VIIKQVKEVLKIEAESILELADKIDDNFVKLVEEIYESSGRVIISGIGKSGLIGKKIAATLNSTGTRSIFLHPVEAMHGDLGIVGSEDIFLAMSNSGETEELNALIPSIKEIGCKIIGFTGNIKSTLANISNIVIDVGVKKEACPMGLVPTSSTTALLSIGDALAVSLIHKRRFGQKDFRKFHPAGNLGKRLSCKVYDIMLKENTAPKIFEGSFLKTAVNIMDKSKLGLVLILKNDETLAGIITDGDLRRFIVKHEHIPDFSLIKVEEIMTENPHTLSSDILAYDALNLMEEHQITSLPIIDANRKLQGILHLHDIFGKGKFRFKLE
jgi:arabinose-5-phosphate isomerase